MTVNTFESLTQFNELINGGKVIVVDFWATWCAPCKVLLPVFEELAEENAKGEVEFYQVDIDELPEVAQEVGVRAVCSQIAQEAGVKGMPTFMVFKDGAKVNELVGPSQDRLTDLVQLGTVLV